MGKERISSLEAMCPLYFTTEKVTMTTFVRAVSVEGQGQRRDYNELERNGEQEHKDIKNSLAVKGKE